MFPLFGEKYLLLVGKVNYDRPFMDHIGWKNTTVFLKNECMVTYDRPLVKYDRPFIGYVGRKNFMAVKVNYDRPTVNYDRPKKVVPYMLAATNFRVYKKEKKGKFRV